MNSKQAHAVTQTIVVKELGVLNLAGDGSRVFMTLVCEGASQTVVSLPADCLKSLIMTLPQVMRQALRLQHNDESLRLVYPADQIRVEQSSDPKTIIVTLATTDGFEVSFGLAPQQIMDLSIAVADARHDGAGGKPLISRILS